MACERRDCRAAPSRTVEGSGSVLVLGEVGGRLRIWKDWICERGMMRYAPAGAVRVFAVIVDVVLDEADVLRTRRLVIGSAV